MGIAMGALGPWSPYLITYFAANHFDHDEVIIETQRVLGYYLSFWLLTEVFGCFGLKKSGNLRIRLSSTVATAQRSEMSGL